MDSFLKQTYLQLVSQIQEQAAIVNKKARKNSASETISSATQEHTGLSDEEKEDLIRMFLEKVTKENYQDAYCALICNFEDFQQAAKEAYFAQEVLQRAGEQPRHRLLCGDPEMRQRRQVQLQIASAGGDCLTICQETQTVALIFD